MKHLFLLLAIVSVFFISCKKEVQPGSATFYTTTNAGEFIKIYINGSAGYISQYYNETPNCEAAGCYSIKLRPGAYTYTASTSVKIITGTIFIEENICNRVHINY